MKKIIVVLMVLICILAIPANAFATSEVSEVDKKFSNVEELFEYWETNGYPDYVGSVYSTDGNMNNLTVLLVNDDGTKANEIRALLADDSGVSFGKAPFSHNAMETVKNEIISNHLGKDDKVYSVGIGWISADGVVIGFGESGKESRVVVFVDESISTDYANKFYELYGDIVVVAAGDAIVYQNQNAVPDNNLWLWLTFMVIISVAAILFFNRTRFVSAMQTNKGIIVTQSVPVSRKKTIEAIKNSEVTPSDEVFNSVLSQIDKKQIKRCPLTEV
ncbi:MAG: hypothetical protein LBL15_02745 [Oscillospiraceae bacterium]|jgi:hypothetical protein|nr:hypothetical protein [Oscillospiraceae bacterium]